MRSSVEDGATRKILSRSWRVGRGDPLGREVGREVGGDQARSPGGGQVGGEPVDAVALDGVPVGHHDGRRAGGGDRLDGAQHVGGADAQLERLLGRGLDGRAVHHRVAVGQADLDDVAAGVDHRAERVDAALRRRGSRPAGSRPARRGPRRAAWSKAVRDAITAAPGSRPAGRRPGGLAEAEVLERGAHVLVAAAGQVDQDRLARAARAASVDAPASAWARLDGRDDALGAGEQRHRLHRLGVGDRAGRSRGRSRRGGRAAGRRRGSRGRRRSSATRRSGRRRPAARRCARRAGRRRRRRGWSRRGGRSRRRRRRARSRRSRPRGRRGRRRTGRWRWSRRRRRPRRRRAAAPVRSRHWRAGLVADAAHEATAPGWGTGAGRRRCRTGRRCGRRWRPSRAAPR